VSPVLILTEYGDQTMKTADRDALERLPTPDEVRQALARRVREAHVLRRLLRVAEHAANELGGIDHDDHDAGTQRREVSRA
jgi:hypothetical protein